MEMKGYQNSFVFADAALSTPDCKEENEGEADAVVEMVDALLKEGKHPADIAVITPFRKQVRLIKAKANDALHTTETPLIDTVERLQGQDVDCIIISFASSDENYIETIKNFLFNLNRLNVMISRAKTKVVIFACEYIQNKLKSLLKEIPENNILEISKERIESRAAADCIEVTHADGTKEIIYAEGFKHEDDEQK